MTIERERTCCFTGHRPEKLHCDEATIKAALEDSIKAAIKDGFNIFISGMARGTDIWAAEVVLRLKNEGRDIKLVCASPYEGFENGWSAEWRERYRHIVTDADSVSYICPKYSLSSFQKRNRWMVNNSARVIAVYDGESGGTRNTIKYANANDVPIVTIGR